MYQQHIRTILPGLYELVCSNVHVTSIRMQCVYCSFLENYLGACMYVVNYVVCVIILVLAVCRICNVAFRTSYLECWMSDNSRKYINNKSGTY